VANFRAYVHVTTGSAEAPVQLPGAAPTFDDVYRSHYARMVVLARLMTGRLVLAEEIVQDAFVQLYRNWASVEFPLTYVRIAVVNGCRQHSRKWALERRHRPSPPEPAVHDTVAIAVRDALQVLTPRQRAAIVLRYFDDLPEREIADALGCRPGTVKSLLSRGITKLKGTLQ
jgi:RNA polymerase sigma-70 factor (sigma-E family)